MARSPQNKPADAANENERAPRRRGSPLTNYMDASVPLERGGFEEAPQPSLSGEPLSGPVSGWAKQISEEAEREKLSPPEGEMSPKATEGGISA
jgi:excinuclease ABC subunit B